MQLRKAIAALIQTSVSAPASGQRALYPKSDGWYDQDSAGVERKLTPVITPITASLTADVSCSASATTTLSDLTITLPIGRYFVQVGLSLVGASAVAVDAKVEAGTATCTITGQQSCNNRANTSSVPIVMAMGMVINVTVAGTIAVKVQCGAAIYTAKQLSNLGSFPNASGIVALPIN